MAGEELNVKKMKGKKGMILLDAAPPKKFSTHVSHYAQSRSFETLSKNVDFQLMVSKEI